MAELPYMQLYVGDYLMDTRHLTLEEHGAYMLLLMEYWTNGHALRDDDRRFSRLLGVTLQKWRALRPALEEFFILDGVTWQHKRIEVDLARTRQKVLDARKAGRASFAKRQSRKKSNKNSGGGSTTVETDDGTQKATTVPTHQNQNITPLPPYRRASADPSLAERPEGSARSVGTLLESMSLVVGKQRKDDDT